MVFGNGKNGPDEDLAIEVLSELVRLYPDGAAKPGAARGKNFAITKFVHKRGFRKSNKIKRARARWDYEMFASKMEHLRGWSKTQSKAEFQKLTDDPKTKRDGLGPKHCPLRLSIPSWMTGMDESASEDEEFEEKALLKESKGAKDMSAEVEAAIHEENS